MSANRAARLHRLSALLAAASALLVGQQASAQPAQAPPKAAEKPQPSAGASGEDINIETPETWSAEPELAAALLPSFLKTVGLRPLEGKGGNAAFVGKQQGAIYVSWVKASKKADNSEAEIRALLNRLRAEPKSASQNASDIEEVTYKEAKAGAALDARLIWRHKANETLTSSRALVWLSPDGLIRVVRAECVFAEEDAKTISPRCAGALASLQADDIDSKRAMALGTVAPPADSKAASDDKAKAKEKEAPGPTMTPTDPKSGVLYKDESAKKKGSSRTRWLFILGAILVVFAFWSITQSKKKDGAGDTDEPDGDGDGDGDGGEEEE